MISKEIDQNDSLKILENNNKVTKYLQNEQRIIYIIKTNCDDWHRKYAVESKIPMQN